MSVICKVEVLSERYILLDSLLFKQITIPEKETALLAIPEICADKIITYNLEFLKNRTKFFSRKTSFHQFSSMASSGLKKMLILIILYRHESVLVNMCLLNFLLDTIFCFISIADVMPYLYRLMLCLGWCFCHVCFGRW